MKQRIIGSELKNKVSDLRGILKFHEEQVELLFGIWSRLNGDLERFAMQWYLVVLTYEFAKNCGQLSNSVNKLVKELPDDNAKENITSALRQQRELKKKCKGIQKTLKPGRNKVGAHFFTHDDGRFLTWEELSRIYGSILGFRVAEYWETLRKYFYQLEKLVDELEKKGYVESSAQPKSIHVTTEQLDWK